MTIEILSQDDCQQGSPAWFEARRGLPTTSRFSAIMAKGEGKTRASYMRELAAEIITGETGESYVSNAMLRGKEQEDKARRTYSLITDNEIRQIGFARDLDKGAGTSTDGLIGDDGVLELKSMGADLLIDVIECGKFPGEHVWQCLGALWVLGRRWCDLAIYAPKMPLFVRRIERDPEKLARLAKEIGVFQVELAAMVRRVQAYGSGA